ncbi:MAG: hypothetical protein V4517_22925 [Pseudomonadota bacterium]
MRNVSFLLGLRFEAGDEAGAAPEFNWSFIERLFRPYNCIIVGIAEKTAVPTWFAGTIDRQRPIIGHVHRSKTKPPGGV